MQIYHFPSRSTYLERAQDVKSYFDSYVTGYFTSIEVNQGSNYADVDFFVAGRDTKAMTIRMNSSDYPQLICGGHTIYIGKRGYTLSSLIVTDSAVFVVGYVASGEYPVFMIHKSVSGHVLVSYFISSGSVAKIALGAENGFRTYSLDNNGYTYVHTYPVTDTPGRTVGTSIISELGGASKDTYIPYIAPFTTIIDPLKYQIGGVNYVAIGGGTFIVRSE